MEILLISSSPHKENSRTYLLAREVLKGGLTSAVFEAIHLCDYKIEFCRHCEECHKKILHCPIKDDVHLILKKMLDAQGIILASPNYINQVTASMKALFDRSSHFIHCMRLSGKYVAGVVSSGSGQDKVVLDYLKFYAHICGGQYSGGISSPALAIQEKREEAHKLGAKLTSDIKGKKEYFDQTELIAKSKEHFRDIIKARKGDWQEEYAYWQKMGWL